MPTAHLHIGSHKTGSTSLQYWLRANRTALKAEGLLVPEAGRMRTQNPAHSALVHSMVAEREGHLTKLPHWDELAAELRGEQSDVILSSEVWSERLQQPRQANRVLYFFRRLKFDIHVVLYLRDYPAFLNSIYVQRVKRFKFGGSFQDFLPQADKEIGLQYERMARPFAKLAPVTVRPFPPVGTTLDADFLASIGRADIDRSELEPLEHANLRIGPLAILAARMIKARWAELPEGSTRDNIEPMFKALCSKHKLSDGQFNGCDEDLATDIRARSASEHEALAETYFDKPWQDAVPQTAMSANELDPKAFRSLPRSEQRRVSAVVEGTLAKKDSSPSLLYRLRRKIWGVSPE